MEMPSVSTIATVGGTVVGGGGLVGWFVKIQIKRVLDAIENLPKDLDGLGAKIRATKAELEEMHRTEMLSLKESLTKTEMDLKVENARLDERLKFLENKK
jgi:hypothetical protein